LILGGPRSRGGDVRPGWWGDSNHSRNIGNILGVGKIYQGCNWGGSRLTHEGGGYVKKNPAVFFGWGCLGCNQKGGSRKGRDWSEEKRFSFPQEKGTIKGKRGIREPQGTAKLKRSRFRKHLPLLLEKGGTWGGGPRRL